MATGKKPQLGHKVLLDLGDLEEAKARSFAVLLLQNLQKLSRADINFSSYYFVSLCSVPHLHLNKGNSILKHRGEVKYQELLIDDMD